MADATFKTLMTLGAGLIGGAVIGWAAHPAEKPSPTSSPSVLDDAVGRELVAELRALREHLTRTRPDTPTRSPAVVENPAAPSTLDIAVFEEFFNALDARLATLVDASGSRRRVSPPSDSFEPRPFPVREEISTKDFSRRHLFWSFQQVVDAYGVADTMSINPHGEHIWGYERGDATLEFVFHDGYVARVEW